MINLIRSCNGLLANKPLVGLRTTYAARSTFLIQKYSYHDAIPVPWPWLELDEICRTSKVPEKFNFATNVFDRYAALTPNKVALWIDNERSDRQYTFEEMKTESIRTALALNTKLHELHPNAKLQNAVVLCVLPRVPEWWMLYLASVRSGWIFCPATVQLSASDIAYRLQVSNAKFIITTPENMDKIEEAQQKLALRSAQAANPDDANASIPPIKICVPPSPENKDKLGKPGWHNYHALVAGITDLDTHAFQNADTISDSIAQVFFTSGTTGKPKMVAHSHTSYGIGQYLTSKVYGLNGIDFMWTLADPGWAKSSYATYAPWIMGAGVYVHQMERFEAHKVLDALCKRPITKFCAPPTFFRTLVQEKNPKLFEFQSLQTCISGGEPLNEEVIRNWQALTPGKKIEIREIYGQTETTATAGYGMDEPRVAQSFGKPINGVELAVVDNNGAELPADQEGNLAIKVKPIRPVGLFKGYITRILPDGEPEFDHTNSCFVGDYYLTGDLATRDNDDYFYFVGRSDDVIISSGYRIGPFEVEDALQSHPAVAENAVVSTPNTLRGTVVKAFIVLADSYRDKDKVSLIKEIQNHCKITTAPFKYPREIEFIDSLPKTVSGKVLRRELRQKEMAKAI